MGLAAGPVRARDRRRLDRDPGRRFGAGPAGAQPQVPAGDIEEDRRQRRVALAERGARLRVAADRRVVELHDVGEAGRCTRLLGALLERLEAVPAARVLLAAVLAL